MTKSNIHPSSRRSFPTWGWVLIALAIIAAAVIVLPQLTQQNASSILPKEVNVATAAQLRDGGAFMLDVREQSEWESFHMPGATLIPLASLDDRLSELPKDQDIVVVCRSGNRSATGRDILLNAGFTNVTSMSGGMNQWQAQGLPTETGP
jgi:rhodanese-related sulfurtransferase